MTALKIFEEVFTRFAEAAEGLIVAVLEHLILEELPQPLEEVEIRGISGQEYQLDAGVLQVRLDRLRGYRQN